MAGVVPGSDLMCKGLDSANAPIQALFGERCSFSLRPMYPTALAWGIGQRKLLGKLESLLRWKSRVTGARWMGMQVVL
jgi:hypothetical protein